MGDFSVYTFSVRQGDLSLTVRGDSAEDVGKSLREAYATEELSVMFESRRASADYPPAQTSVSHPPAPVNAVQQMVDETKARQEATQSDVEAYQKAQEHLGPGEERASDALTKAAAAKSGKTVEELEGISKNKAVAIINGEEV